MLLNEAIAMAAEGHRHQKDKGGKPYILHPIRVMQSFAHTKDPELMSIAILHDLVEDTNTTLTDLKYAGFSDRVLDAVDCLTKRDGEPLSGYMSRIKSNKDAILVKLADIRDNTDITRLKGLREKDIERTRKYHEMFVELEAIYNARYNS